MGREGVQATSERAVAASDRDTFAEFVRPHWGIMASLARRLTQSDGDDVLQDALAAAWRKRAQFDPDRGTPRNWLLAIVADQAAKGRRRIRPVTELVDVAETERDRDVDVDLRAALLQLTDRQRTAVTLHYYLGVPSPTPQPCSAAHPEPSSRPCPTRAPGCARCWGRTTDDRHRRAPAPRRRELARRPATLARRPARRACAGAPWPAGVGVRRHRGRTRGGTRGRDDVVAARIAPAALRVTDTPCRR